MKPMADYAETLELLTMLEGDLPPGDDQPIVYGLSGLRTPGCTIHAGQGCPETFTRQTTVGELLKTLGDDNINFRCGHCFNGGDAIFKLVMSGAKKHANTENFTNFLNMIQDSKAMLCFEAWKPGNEDAWCQWFCGKTAKQIRQNAQKALGWRPEDSLENQEEDLVLCFDVGGGNSNNWMVAAGEHVSVNRRGSLWGVKVHGLVPQRILEDGNSLTSVEIPVGKAFTTTHLKLAVGLFEAQDRCIWEKPVVGGKTKTRIDAENAVQTAVLVLS